MWIASVTNIDWPTKPGLSAQQQKDELLGWLDLAKSSNYNAVMLQVRPTADTFWPSELEPWSHWLTGKQGVDPGYDPLGFAVAEAHKRGLQVHAWYNPYRIAMDEAGKTLIDSHPARQHPEWTIPYGGKLYYNPGLPEVIDHSIAVIIESVKKYDIDAVHFDDYFYPYPVAGKVFDDSAAYASHGNGLSLEDWRRNNIDTLIHRLSVEIKRAKPHVQFGVSPFAVWRNKSDDPAGSDTKAGAPTYDTLFADTRKWVREEWLDYINPQVYWSLQLEVARYDKVSKWWIDEVAGRNVHLYIGQASYKIALNADPAWSDPHELDKHLAWNSAQLDSLGGEAIAGNVYFSAKDVRDNRLNAHGIINGTWYSKPALPPKLPWLDATPPAAPTSVKRRGGRLSISHGGSDVAYFVVYRFDKKTKVDVCAIADASNIAAILPATTREWTDAEVIEDFGKYTWCVSAVDRLSNESKLVAAR